MQYFFVRRTALLGLAVFLAAGALSMSAQSQPAASGPPAVGVVEAQLRPVTESFEFTGRVQAINRVGLVARVNAFLDERLFQEGADVKKGDLLYRLERGPYEAEVAVRQAAIAQAEAQLTNARVGLARAQELRKTGSGTQVALDNALEQERTAAAQLQSAKAQVRQAEINLGYTEIRAPIDGRIGRTAVTEGNVVGPSSGVLATIVSQDPMYVTFPVPVPTAEDLRNRYASQGFGAVGIKLRFADGRLYKHDGKLEFADITVAQDTDTITLRGVIPNPELVGSKEGSPPQHELVDGQFVTVILEAVKPVDQLTIPREAVLSDQRGDFVYVVGAENKVERRAVKLGQSTPGMAVIADGLKEGERVVLEGVQRIQPNMTVAPGPAETSQLNPSAAPAKR